MKAAARQLIKDLESLGFVWTRTNAKGHFAFTKSDAPDVLVNPSMDERIARELLGKVCRQLGCVPQTNKRNVKQIRERAHARRLIVQAELDRHRERLNATRRPSGALARFAPDEIREIERLIADGERELQEIESLMRTAPLGNSARHRAGQP